MSAPSGSGSSWFEERDQQGLLDFWRVYDTHYDDVSRSMAQAFSADAKLARIFDGPGVVAARKETRELVRRSVGSGDWSPYEAQLRISAANYARAGLTFERWYILTVCLADVVTPQMVEAYDREPARLIEALRVMSRFLDRVRVTLATEFLAAHELEILGYANLLFDELTPEDPIRAEVDEIRKAGLRAADLTRQLLAFSRQQMLQPSVLDPNRSLAGIQKMLGRVLGEDVVLTLLPCQDVGKVYVDPGQFEQVIMNLVVNARDAMPRGGNLTIETVNLILHEQDAAEHHGIAPGPYVMIAVTDTGVGIDKETISRIFDPFFTTKAEGKGTGLGLSTVYGILQQSGGHISVDSEPGTGTTFKVYLPRTDRRSSPAASDQLSDTSYRGDETVLLVEDEEQVRAVARAILRQRGYNVLEAQNGGEAFLISERFDATIHLLLTDVVMPRMSGRELAERLRASRPEMKVLYVSGYTTDTTVLHGMLEAGVAFLQKPITPDVLASKVRDVLDGVKRNSVSLRFWSMSGKPANSGTPDKRECAPLPPLAAAALEPVPPASPLEAVAEHGRAELDDADDKAAVLQALLESAPDLVIHVDQQGRIRFINRLAQGFRREDVIGTEWLAFVGSDQHGAPTAALQKTLATGQTTEVEILGPGDQGAPTWYWTRIAAVRRRGRVSGAVLLARDITEKKLAETRLVVSERMASLGMLAAGVAHELDNPLVSVIANLELAMRDIACSSVAPLSDNLSEVLKDARDGAERVRHIVRDLRIFSRHEDEERGAVQVERVLDSTLRMAATEIRHRARVVTSYAGVPPVDGSEGQLGQVFLNLLMNAAQALPEGRFDANEIRVATSLDEHGHVLVSVADTGPGIPVDVQRRMFTPFFTTKPIGVGTGLGLCICQRIITSLGGKIWFESMSGHGTVFRVLLPPASKAASKPTTGNLETNLPAHAPRAVEGELMK